MMMDREGRALPGASSESRGSAPKRSLQGGRRDSNIYACPSASAGSRTNPGLDSSESRLWAQSIAESALLSSRVDVEGEEEPTVVFVRNQDTATSVESVVNIIYWVQEDVLAVVRMARRTTVSRVRGDYFQDGRVPTGTTTISKRGEATR